MLVLPPAPRRLREQKLQSWAKARPAVLARFAQVLGDKMRPLSVRLRDAMPLQPPALRAMASRLHHKLTYTPDERMGLDPAAQLQEMMDALARERAKACTQALVERGALGAAEGAEDEVLRGTRAARGNAPLLAGEHEVPRGMPGVRAQHLQQLPRRG